MKFYFTYFLLIVATAINAQTPSYKQYETDNGLPSNEVYNMLQDKNGFLWLGSAEGLVKYDGTRFTTYKNNNSKNNAVSHLRLDGKGNVWCTNFSGQVFYIANDSLKLFTPFEIAEKNDFAKIAFDNENNLIVTASSNVIWQYNFKFKRLTTHTFNKIYALHFPHNAYNNKLIVSSTDVKNKILLFQNNQLQNIAIKNENGDFVNDKFYNRFEFYNSLQNKQTLAFQHFHLLQTKPNLFYWHNNNFVEHSAAKLLQQINAYPQAVFDDDNGNLLIGTNKNLVWLKNENNVWKVFVTMLSGSSVSSILKDRENNIWISTLKNGVYKIANENIFTLDFLKNSFGINHLTTNNSNNIFGSFLNGELLDYNINTKQKTVISFSEKRDIQTLTYNKFNKNVYACFSNLYTYNSNNKSITNLNLMYANTKDISFDNNNISYIATTDAEIIFPKNKKISTNLLLKYDTVYNDYFFENTNKLKEDKIVLKAKRCRNVFYNITSNLLWYGFIDGLAFVKNKKFQYIYYSKNNEPIITNQFAYDSINNLLYVATIKQGVLVFSNTKMVNEINVEKGLASNHIKKIRYYHNAIWLIVDDKIQSYNLATKHITTVDMQDGLLSKELYDVELLNDTAYIASSKGIQFFPISIKTNNDLPPFIQIKKIVVDDSLYNNFHTLNLSSNTKSIKIELQGVALKSSGTATYKYRLLPHDTNWISVTANENSVRFSSLNFGNYTFQAKTINEDGVASQIISSTIIINKPFWMQWWFLTIIATITGLGIYHFSKRRLQLQNKQLQLQLNQSKLEEELRHSQLTSLKSQMNPHFMFNALNSIQEFIILNDKKQANMFMGKFSDLMRKTLDMSGKEEVSLDEEIAILKLYLELEALRFEDNFEYNIFINNNVDIMAIRIPSMLIQPYIENAIKHGLMHKQGTKKIFIQFSTADSLLSCTITDNGIGRKRSLEINATKAKQHASFATGATQKRLELLNNKRDNTIAVKYNDLETEDKQPAGTEIVITIPFTK